MQKKYIANATSYGYLGRYWKKHDGTDTKENSIVWKPGMPEPNKWFTLVESTEEIKELEPIQELSLSESLKEALGVRPVMLQPIEQETKPEQIKPVSKPQYKGRGRRK